MAGYNPNDLPDEISRDYEVALGKARQKVLRKYADNLLDRIEKNPSLLKDRKKYDQARSIAQRLDTQAARIARGEINRMNKAAGKPTKRLNKKARRGPAAFTPESEE